MKKFIRLFSLITVIAVIFSLFAGCGSSTKTTTSDDTKTVDQEKKEPIKLTMRTNYNEQGNTRGDIFKAALDKYLDANKNIQVEYEAVDPDTNKLKSNVEVAGGTTPDIFVVTTRSIAEQYVKSGILADLTPYLEKDTAWRDTFISGALFKTLDKNYIIPNEGFAELVWYNKDIFAKYNIKVPETWSDFTAAIKILKDNNIVPIALGDKSSWVAGFFVQMIMDKVAGTDTLNKAIKGEIKFNNPDYVKAVQLYIDLIDAKAFNKDAAIAEEAQGDAMFYTEKAAMECTGTWAIGKWVGKDANPGFNAKVGAFILPSIDGGKGDPKAYFGGFNSGYAISANLKDTKLDAAVELLKFVTGPEYFEPMVTKNGSISPINLPGLDKTQTQKPLIEAQAVLAGSSGSIGVYDGVMPQAVATAWFTSMQKWLSGSKDIAGGLDDIDKAVEKQLKASK